MGALSIKTGFRRVGIVLAVPCLLTAAIAGGVLAYELATLPTLPPVSGPKVIDFSKESEVKEFLERQSDRSLQDQEIIQKKDRAHKAGLWAMVSAIIAALAFILS